MQKPEPFHIHVQTHGTNGRYLSANEIKAPIPLFREFTVIVTIAVSVAYWLACKNPNTVEIVNNDYDYTVGRGPVEVVTLILVTWYSARLISAYERQATPGFGFMGNTLFMIVRIFTRVSGGPREVHWLQDEKDERMKGHLESVRNFADKMLDLVPKEDVEKIREIRVQMRDGTMTNVRITFPASNKTNENDSSSLPSFAFYCHGGAFCANSPKSMDFFARAAANAMDAVVVAPHYRLAPEHKFPTAHEDCFDAFNAVVNLISGEKQGGPGEASLVGSCDLSKIAIFGDSAGGNIATHLAFCLSRPSINDSFVPSPKLHLPPKANLKALLLFNPVVTPYSPTSSNVRLTRGPLICEGMITWMWNKYLKDPLVDSYHPTVNLLLDKNVNFCEGDDNNKESNIIPSTVIVTGYFDPLCDEGEQLAKWLASKMMTTQAHTKKQQRRVYAVRRLEAHGSYHPSTTQWAFQAAKALLNDTDVVEAPQ